MQISSPSFKNKDMIPEEYTCQGRDINPPLEISGVPRNTQSLALIVDDPDAPMGTWVHWVDYNIPPEMTRINEDSAPGVQGMNSYHKLDYGGPCPPSGKHHYHFKAYALDAKLPLQRGASKADVEKAMRGHILDQADLVGMYERR
jgi:Raf kinase inhibitor-like YbhB/YbcL family protein